MAIPTGDDLITFIEEPRSSYLTSDNVANNVNHLKKTPAPAYHQHTSVNNQFGVSKFYGSPSENCPKRVNLKNKRPLEIVTALFDYRAKFSDELSLKRGSVIEVLSKDAKISGDEGWWTGKLKSQQINEAQVGIFPSNFVQSDLNAALIDFETRICDEENDPLSSTSTLPNLLHVEYSEIEFGPLIGVGGFGKVHKANWRDRSIAVKTAYVELGPEAKAVKERVEREARLFHSLSHPNVVELIGVSQAPEADLFCLLLEYCAGDSLSKVLKQSSAGGVQRLSPNVLIDWAHQIAEGMHYLHDQAPIPLVHRDLKSSNVLIKQDVSVPNFKYRTATLKIGDFGLAREAYHTSRMSMAGTYAWMAPEVIKSYTYSKASDVWSFGVLLWELLTGETPYKNIDSVAIAYGIAVNQLTLPVPSTCPEPFAQMMQECWSIEPHKRPMFKQILQSLADYSDNNAMGLEDESFYLMQDNWREEIQALFSEIKSLEHELRHKEEQLKSTAARQEMKEEILRQREAELEHREIELVHRELKLLLQKPVEPPRKHGKSGKLFGGKPTLGEIGLPTDFRNLISVKHVVPYPTSSHTPPVSPQGARGELRVLAYDKASPNGLAPSKLSSPESPLAPSVVSNSPISYTPQQIRCESNFITPPYGFATLRVEKGSPRLSPSGGGACTALSNSVNFHRSTPDLHRATLSVARNTKGELKLSPVDFKISELKSAATEPDTDEDAYQQNSHNRRKTSRKSHKFHQASSNNNSGGGRFLSGKIGDAWRSITTALQAVPLGRSLANHGNGNTGDHHLTRDHHSNSDAFFDVSCSTAATFLYGNSSERRECHDCCANSRLNNNLSIRSRSASVFNATVSSTSNLPVTSNHTDTPVQRPSRLMKIADKSILIPVPLKRDQIITTPTCTLKRHRPVQPVPTDRYRSYTRNATRGRSTDTFPFPVKLSSISNPNYERHFVGCGLGNIEHSSNFNNRSRYATGPPLNVVLSSPCRPLTLDVTSQTATRPSSGDNSLQVDTILSNGPQTSPCSNCDIVRYNAYP